jgi:hypothetical protein
VVWENCPVSSSVSLRSVVLETEGNESYLVGLVAHDGADGLLHEARSGVDVRLKSGSVVVRHGGLGVDCLLKLEVVEMFG